MNRRQMRFEGYSDDYTGRRRGVIPRLHGRHGTHRRWTSIITGGLALTMVTVMVPVAMCAHGGVVRNAVMIAARGVRR